MFIAFVLRRVCPIVRVYDQPIFRKIGGAVDLFRESVQSFIKDSTAEELVQALKGEKQELQLETGLRLEPALQALEEGCSLSDIIQQVIESLEKYLITQILVSTGGNKAEAARILQVDYKTLYRKMYRYFGTFADFVPPTSADGETLLAPSQLASAASNAGLDLRASPPGDSNLCI